MNGDGPDQTQPATGGYGGPLPGFAPGPTSPGYAASVNPEYLAKQRQIDRESMRQNEVNRVGRGVGLRERIEGDLKSNYYNEEQHRLARGALERLIALHDAHPEILEAIDLLRALGYLR